MLDLAASLILSLSPAPPATSALTETASTLADDERLVRERALREQISKGDRAAVERLLSAAAGVERRRHELALLECDVADPEIRAERPALLAKAMAARATLLERTDDPRFAIWAVDQAEALLLVRPSITGSDIAATVGFLLPDERASLQADVEAAKYWLDAARLERPTNDPLLETDRHFRQPLLRTLALARAIDLRAQGAPLASNPASSDQDLRTSIDRLPAGTRDALRMALARIALSTDPELAGRDLAAIRSARDASPTAVIAADALAAIGAAERGEAEARAMARQLAAGANRAELARRLLVADTGYRVEVALDGIDAPTALDPWIELFSRSSDADRITLRGPLLARIESASRPPLPSALASAPTLVLSAFAPELWPHAAESLAVVLAERAGQPDDAGHRLALFDLGRTLAKLRRYAEAASAFRRFATEFGDDPLARSALDFALEIDRELAYGRPPADPAVAALRQSLAIAIERYPLDGRRFAWRVEAARLAIDIGQPAEALALLAGVPSSSAQSIDARLTEVAALLAQAPSEASGRSLADATARIETLAIPEADAARRAELFLLRARCALLQGAIAEALRDAATVVASAEAPESLRAAALSLALEVQCSGEGDAPVRLPSGAESIADPRLTVLLARHVTTSLEAIGARLDAGDIEGAERLARRRLAEVAPVLARHASSADDDLLAARALLALGRGFDALATLRGAASRSPNDPILAIDLARALRQSGDGAALVEAATILRATQASVPDRSAAWWEAECEMIHVIAATPGAEDALRTRVGSLRITDPSLGGPRQRALFDRLVPPPTDP